MPYVSVPVPESVLKSTCENTWIQPLSTTVLAHPSLMELFQKEVQKNEDQILWVGTECGYILAIILIPLERDSVEPGILSSLQADRLAYSCIVDVYKKHKFPGSETRDFITAQQAAPAPHVFIGPLTPLNAMGMKLWGF